jgi:hypothetical protein
MTAYIKRIGGLTGGEPSLRVRPRSRFEPAPPETEPPWAGTVPGPAPRPAEAGDAGPAESWPETLWPAADDPREAARPRSGPRPGRSPAWLGSSPAPDSPGPSELAEPSAGARRRPPGPPGRPGLARGAAADRAESGAQDARSARPAPDDQLVHRDERRGSPGPTSPSPLDPAVEPPEAVPAPVSPGRDRSGPVPPDRSGAEAGRPVGTARRPDSASPAGSAAGSTEPAFMLSGDRLQGRGRPVRSELAGPYLGRISGPDGFAAAGPGPGDVTLLAGDRGGPSRPEHPDPGWYPPAGRTQPDEITVSIGRVEVRVSPAPAVSGPAAPPAAPSPRPQPSRLEEYLRARTAGRVG